MQHQVTQLVNVPDLLIVEIDGATRNDDVVNRKFLRLAGGRYRCAGQPGNDVVDVVFSAGEAGQLDHRCIDGHSIDDRGQAQQGLQFDVGINAADLQLGLTSVRRCNAQVVQREFKGPWLELDRTDQHLPAQFFAGNGLQPVLENRRYGNPGDQPEREHHKHDHSRAPDPFVLYQSSWIHQGWSVPQTATPALRSDSRSGGMHQAGTTNW